MKASLVSLNQHVPDCDTSLKDLPAVLGSSPDVDIRLSHHSVSRYHCRIERIDGHFVVYDLGSVHGTFVNGSRIVESPLRPGDCLGIGLLSFFLQCLPEAEDSWTPVESELALTGVGV